MKKAFTLIEMLVVVGIIAVLMSIVLVNVRGTADAANATKCASNLRSLFNAVNAVGMETKYYPFAGHCIRRGYGGNGKNALVTHDDLEGWVSRIAENVVPCYGTGNEDENRNALANGNIGKVWKAVARNASVYSCPTFTKDLLVKRGCKPVFSYVMNAGQQGITPPKPCGFGSDITVDYQSMAPDGSGMIAYGSYSRADRMIMFAELPISQSCSYNPLATPDTCDATLQFNMKIGGTQYGNSEWKGRSEEIGFVHQDKRKKYFGNVIFVDGHVERFMQPPRSSSLKADELTAYICSGADVAYDDEKGYRFIDD